MPPHGAGHRAPLGAGPVDQTRALGDAEKTPQPLCFSSAQVEMSTAVQAPVLDTQSEEDPLQLYTLSLGIMNAVAADGADTDHAKARCHALARARVQN